MWGTLRTLRNGESGVNSSALTVKIVHSNDAPQRAKGHHHGIDSYSTGQWSRRTQAVTAKHETSVHNCCSVLRSGQAIPRTVWKSRTRSATRMLAKAASSRQLLCCRPFYRCCRSRNEQGQGGSTLAGQSRLLASNCGRASCSEMICFAACSQALNIGRMQSCGGAQPFQRWAEFLCLLPIEFGARLCSAMRVVECTRAVIHITRLNCVLALAAPRLRNFQSLRTQSSRIVDMLPRLMQHDHCSRWIGRDRKGYSSAQIRGGSTVVLPISRSLSRN
jgi:hypothetical protein